MSPASRWTDDAIELARRLGTIGLPAEVLTELEAAAGAARTSAEEFAKVERRFSKFPIVWSFDRSTRATVLISRSAGTITVRPHKRRRTYTLPLATVAELIADRVAKADVVSRRKLKKRARR